MPCPPSLVEAACAVLEEDERLGSSGVACDARAERLARARAILHTWSLGTVTAEQAAMTAFDPDGYAVEFAQGKRGKNQPKP